MRYRSISSDLRRMVPEREKMSTKCKTGLYMHDFVKCYMRGKDDFSP